MCSQNSRIKKSTKKQVEMTHEEMCQAWRETLKKPLPDRWYFEQVLFYKCSSKACEYRYQYMLNWVKEMQDRYGECDD